MTAFRLNLIWILLRKPHVISRVKHRNYQTKLIFVVVTVFTTHANSLTFSCKFLLIIKCDPSNYLRQGKFVNILNYIVRTHIKFSCALSLNSIAHLYLPIRKWAFRTTRTAWLDLISRSDHVSSARDSRCKILTNAIVDELDRCEIKVNWCENCFTSNISQVASNTFGLALEACTTTCDCCSISSTTTLPGRQIVISTREGELSEAFQKVFH